MTGWSLEMDWHPVVWTGLLQGVGLGLVFVPLNVMSFATLPSEYSTDGPGLLRLSRNIGASLGISVVSFLLARNIQIRHADVPGHITSFNLPTDPNTTLSCVQRCDSPMSVLGGEITRQVELHPH